MKTLGKNEQNPMKKVNFSVSPDTLFDFFIPLISNKAFAFTNGAIWKERHAIYFDIFSKKQCQNLLPKISEVRDRSRQ